MPDWLVFVIGIALGMMVAAVVLVVWPWWRRRDDRHQTEIERRLGITRTPDTDPGAVSAPRFESSHSWKR